MAGWPRIAMVLVLGGAACAPKAPVDTTPVSSVHPELQCPPGTWAAGQGPPEGLEVWCEVRSPTDAVRQGPSITWHPNGRRAAEGSWVGGKRHGEWKVWHANGTPSGRGTYSHGLREGVWTFYHPDGTRESEGAYVGDQQHGTWVFWSADALTRTEGRFELGLRTGRWIDHDPGGLPVRERIYREGRLVNQRELGG